MRVEVLGVSAVLVGPREGAARATTHNRSVSRVRLLGAVRARRRRALARGEVIDLPPRVATASEVFVGSVGADTGAVINVPVHPLWARLLGRAIVLRRLHACAARVVEDLLLRGAVQGLSLCIRAVNIGFHLLARAVVLPDLPAMLVGARRQRARTEAAVRVACARVRAGRPRAEARGAG